MGARLGLWTAVAGGWIAFFALVALATWPGDITLPFASSAVDAPAEAEQVASTAAGPANSASASATMTAALPSPSPSPSSRPLPTPSPAATPPAPLPIVSGLVVCDASVDCGDGAAAAGATSVTVCLRVAQRGNRPPILVVTGGDQPPASAGGPSVVARTGPLAQTEMFGCYSVATVRGPLASGTYWLWVLVDSTALASAPFQVR